MSNVKNGLSYFETGGSAEGSSYSAPESGAEVTVAKSASGITPAGKVRLGADQTAGILAEMQKIIEQRQSPMNQFLGGLQEASAWGAGGAEGPSAALTAVRRQKQLEQADTLGMQEKMAALKAQQQQAALRRESMGNFMTGLKGGEGNLPAGLDPAVLARVEQLYSIGQEDAADKLLNAHMADVGKIKSTATYSPGTYEKKIEVTLPDGSIGYESVSDRLSGKGVGTPTAKGQAELTVIKEQIASGKTAASEGRGNAVQIASNLGIPLISGDRDWDKQYNLYLESKKPGYKGNPVAFPGTSKHETGFAIDVGPLTDKQREDLIAAGFKQPLPQKDPNHWELQAKPAEVAPVTPPVTPAAPKPAAVTAPTVAPVAPTAAPAAAPVAPTAAPAAPAPIAAPTMPTVRANVAVNREAPISAAQRNQAEIDKTLAMESGKSNIAALQKEETKLLERTDPSSLAGRSDDVNQMNELIRKWGGDKTIAGIFNDPGFTNALATAIKQGVEVPSGTISAPAIEDAIRRMEPNASREKIEAAQDLARLMGKRLMDVVAKSKGSTSDKDMVAFRQIAGSADSGWNTISKLNNYDKLALKTDERDRELYNKTFNGRNFDYAKHSINPERIELYKQHARESERIAKERYTPTKTPNRPEGVPPGAEYNEKLNKWRYKDASGKMVIVDGK